MWLDCHQHPHGLVLPFLADDLLSRALASPQQGQDTQAPDQLPSLLLLLLFHGHQHPPSPPQTTPLSARGLNAVLQGKVKEE